MMKGIAEILIAVILVTSGGHKIATMSIQYMRRALGEMLLEHKRRGLSGPTQIMIGKKIN